MEMFRKRTAGVIVAMATMVFLLAACSGGGGDGLPPERSITQAPDSDRPNQTTAKIHGYVVDDVLVGATLNVYAFDEGRKGALLATTKTADDGSYQLDINAATGLLLLEARGGSYRELMSGAHVTVKDNEVLQAVILHQAGIPRTVMVTPLTHLISALTHYRIAEGQSPRMAYHSAADDVNHLFDLDVTQVYPRSIADVGSRSGLNDEHIYGFYLAAYSAWSAWVGEQNGIAPHTSYTSLGTWQLIYKDLIDDGRLDGRAQIAGAQSAMALGTVNLSTDVYRIAFVQHVLASTMHHANATDISLSDMLPLMLAFLERSSSFLPAAGDGATGVEIHGVEPEGLYHNGSFDFAVLIANPHLVEEVRFALNGQDLGAAANHLLPVMNIGPTQYGADGDYVITVRATDYLGNVVSRDFTIRIDNSSPYVNVLSAAITRHASHVLSGNYGDNGAGRSGYRPAGI